MTFLTQKHFINTAAALICVCLYAHTCPHINNIIKLRWSLGIQEIALHPQFLLQEQLLLQLKERESSKISFKQKSTRWVIVQAPDCSPSEIHKSIFGGKHLLVCLIEVSGRRKPRVKCVRETLVSPHVSILSLLHHTFLRLWEML